MANVSVSKGFLIGVVAVAAASLLALTFVLGRESGSGSVAPPPARIERIAPRAPEQTLPPPARVAAANTDSADMRAVSGPTPSAGAQDAAPPAAAGRVSVPIEGERNSGGPDPMRAAVAAYFDTVERIQVGSTSGEPETIAREIASALSSGDTSGVDKLIRETEAARTGLAAVAPPVPCAAHHRESLGSLDDAVEVLRALKAAMESGDPVGQLGAVSTRALALQSRAEVLQREEVSLKERYGLKR